jgi:hypothetical protein
MGTRSLTGVRIGGTDKIAYNQFDGYFAGVGATILKELTEFRELHGDGWIDRLRELATKVEQISWNDPITPEMVSRWGADAHDRSVSTGSDAYSFFRRDQGTIVKRLVRGAIASNLDAGMAGYDAEYGYLVNLDDEVLEVYVSRWPRTKPDEGNRYRDMNEPLHLHGTYPLNELPAELAEPDDEEEAA